MKNISDTKQKLLSTALDLIWENSYGTVSVDEICRRAKVLKGSFYHFFPSKSDLAVAAFEEYWTLRRVQLDRAFSPQVSPVERLSTYCEQVEDNQRKRFLSTGKVGGCPFSTVGSELSTRDERVRKTIEEIGRRVRTYIESALRDAARQKLTSERDIPLRAAQFYAFVTGSLLQARITNNIEILKSLKPAMARLLEIELRQAA